MKRIQLIIGILWTIFFTSNVYATSFIAECSDETWREEQSDVVLEGTVLSSEPYLFQGETHTRTVFKVDVLIKGNYTQGTITVRHYGNVNVGPQAISLTMDYRPGEQYRLELLKNEEEEGTYSLVCGEFSSMKLEDAPEGYVTSEEPISLWTRIVLFFKNLF